jgi:hypothetical protein
MQNISINSQKTFYHLSNKSYELNNLAGRKPINTLTPYQTA